MSLILALVSVPACEDADDDAALTTEETDGVDPAVPPGMPELPTFIPATRTCRPPLDGEPPGQSDGGQICTWQGIPGATEEGRRFRDYASCDVVRTQRPYYPVPPADTYAQEEPRMQDPEYVAELDWVRAQVDASGCSCCHSSDAPAGPVRWSVDMPGHWVSAMSDRDVAGMAEWYDTTVFGRYEPEDNNGFVRAYGMPSTDPERILAFFEAELDARGLVREDFADAPPTGGPLIEQETFVPGACTEGEGVAPDGTVLWLGGPARYVYVLEAGSENPTIPPNKDLPAGTRWRLDVHHRDLPIAPGSLRYGDVPSGRMQRHPVDGPPAALQVGETYYLYVTKDVFQPITRCLFTFGS